MDNHEPVRISVVAEREVAYRSLDHIYPWGTKNDNSRNKRFNYKLFKLYGNDPTLPKVLDLGCSGGGFVKDCIDAGRLAVGIEGSDYSKVNKRAEWGTIPQFLFTADVTGTFDVLMIGKNKDSIMKFDVVTSWEMIEHISEDDLYKVARNVDRHLAQGGLWIMSVSPNDDIINGVNLHQTIKPKEWWVEKFKQLGFTHREEYVRYFNTQFVRGPKFGCPGSFHLILTRNGEFGPSVPREGVKSYLVDKWLGSGTQRAVRSLLIGFE